MAARSLWLLLLCTLTLSAAEEKATPWYTIELLIFEQPAAQRSDSETWATPNSAVDLEHAIRLRPSQALDPAPIPTIGADVPQITPSIEVNQAQDTVQQQDGQTDEAAGPSYPLPFSVAPYEQWELTPLRIKLERSKHYVPLLHTAWVQPGLSSEESKSVYLSSGDMLASEALGAPTAAPTTNPAELVSDPYTLTATPPTNTLSTTASPPPLPSKLEGIIRIRLSRYLHADVDLIYREFDTRVSSATNRYQITPITGQLSTSTPATPYNEGGLSTLMTTALASIYAAQAEAPSGIKSYTMQESRRMRSRKLHYLDHPYMGILIQITPLELPVTDVTSASIIPPAK